MKNKILLLMAAMLATTAGFAQSDGGKIGLYIGPNYSNISITSPQLTAAHRSGYQFGAYFRKGGVIYGQMGLEYLKLQTDLVQDDSLSGAVDLNKLQLPLYGGLNILNPVKNTLNVRLFAGPVINYTLSAPSYNPEFSLTDFSRFGLNGTVGAGVDVLIFTIDAGYTFGLNNLFSGDLDGNADYAFLNVGLKF